MTGLNYRIRSMEMEKLAEIKQRINMEKVIFHFNDLGSAATAFDLLRIKHTNSISIENSFQQSSFTKGTT